MAASIASLYRYPVKSMMGEELNSTLVTQRGLYGDRAFALVDAATGKVASAKNPRKWPNLFAFRASYVEPPSIARALGSVRIALPSGAQLTSDHSEADAMLSSAIGRDVLLKESAPAAPGLEEYWPDIEGLAHRDAVTDEKMPPSTFFDCAVVHVLTTGTLAALQRRYPQGRFEVRRFRPNIVVDVPGAIDFTENDWVGKTLSIGDAVRLKVSMPCGRCVMTTLAQADLPHDNGILRTAAQHNSGHVGIYAEVISDGEIRVGDTVTVG